MPSEKTHRQAAEIHSNGYTGQYSPDFQIHDLEQIASQIQSALQADNAQLIAGGRNQNICLPFTLNNTEQSTLVKWFGKQSSLKDRIDLSYRQSKAHRSFSFAMHLLANGVATPTPIAFLDKVEKQRLVESYFLTQFKPQSVSFHDSLLFLLHNQPTASELVQLLDQVAQLCRRMHEAGFVHNDLGNQNILLKQLAERQWDDPCVIDLNRGRIFEQLSLSQRGKDLSRLSMPSNLLLMFVDMYWGAPAPKELIDSLQRHTRRFALRARTRKLRHPIREARIARESASLPASSFMPLPKDTWIWDDTSDQALSALDRRERIKQYPRGRSSRLLFDTVAAGFGVWRDYRRTLNTAFVNPVTLSNRIGLAIEPTAETLEEEIAMLQSLGTIPLVVRCCHHDTPDRIAFQVALIKRLASDGHGITLALVQDRRAIIEPASWRRFVMELLKEVASHVKSIEYGHAINRVKWGIWDFRELREFYAPLNEIAETYPSLNVIGPATIDFEYPFLLSALKDWPKSIPLSALSHHLYVDRRGAPENQQSGFGALQKFALAKSIANTQSARIPEVVVSEVNWPLADTSVYSPVTAPFEYRNAPPGSLHDSGVSESVYADYMVRYLALALGSGFVDRVYWWRLVARGYGLVDREGDELRQRPAFLAFRQFIQSLGDATLVAAEIPSDPKSTEGRYLIQFRREDGELVGLCWQHGPAQEFPAELSGAEYQDCVGNTLASCPVELQGSPIYIRQCRETLKP